MSASVNRCEGKRFASNGMRPQALQHTKLRLLAKHAFCFAKARKMAILVADSNLLITIAFSVFMKRTFRTYVLFLGAFLALPLFSNGQAPVATRPNASQLATKLQEIVAMPPGPQRLMETLRLTRNPAAINPESERLLAQCVHEADSLGEHGLKAELMANQAYVLIGKGEHATAERLLDSAGATTQTLDEARRLSPLNSLAIGYQRMNRMDKAMAAFRQVAAFTKGKDDPDMRMHYMTVLQNMGNLYHRSGKYDEQLATVEEARALVDDIELPAALFNIKFNIAASLVQLNKHEEAAAIFNELMPDIERNAAGRTPRFYDILGDHHQRMGNEAAAAEFYSRIFHTPTALPQEKLRAAVQLVKLHVDMGNADSVAVYEKHVAEGQKNPMARYDERDILLMEGMVHAFRAEHGRAKQRYRAVVASPSPAGQPVSSAKVAGNLGLAAIYKQEGKADSARQALAQVASQINSPYLPHALKTAYYQLASEVAAADNSAVATDSLLPLAAAQHAATDSLLQAASARAYADMESKYRLQEKEYALQLSEQRAALQEMALGKQRQRQLILLLGSLAVVLALAGVIAALAYRRRQQAQQHESEKTAIAQQHRIDTAKALKEAQEQERKAIANKLHDEVGATLSIAKLNVSQLDEAVFVAGSGAEEKLKTTEKLLDEMSETVRQLSHTLMPIALEKYGLKRGIEDLLQAVATAKKIQVEQVIEGLDDTTGWAPDFCLSFYRIVQEILNNVLKHARATHALVQIVELADSVTVYIEDNGKGIVETGNSSGLGLKLLRSNIAYLDGTIEINGSENNGTFVLIELPITIA